MDTRQPIIGRIALSWAVLLMAGGAAPAAAQWKAGVASARTTPEGHVQTLATQAGREGGRP